MGILVNVHCRGCHKNWELHEGVGMLGYAKIMSQVTAIESGKIKNERAKQLLMLGEEAVPEGFEDEFFRCYGEGAVYVCEKCKELKNSDDLYFKVNVRVLPGKKLTYNAWFPFGQPKCQECGTELKFVRDIRSTEVKCPSCGGNLSAKNVGCFD